MSRLPLADKKRAASKVDRISISDTTFPRWNTQKPAKVDQPMPLD